METKTAIITYGVQDSESSVEVFCKTNEEFYNNVQKAMEFGKTSTTGRMSDLLIQALEANVLDGSDFMILALYGLRTILRRQKDSSIFGLLKMLADQAKEMMGEGKDCDSCTGKDSCRERDDIEDDTEDE